MIQLSQAACDDFARNIARFPLRGELCTVVDARDAHLATGLKWSAHRRKGHNTIYAKRRGPNGKKQSLHRLIMRAKKGEIVDHINRNGLDNRRCNLRVCSQSKNQWNSRVSKSSRSSIRGIRKRVRDSGLVRWEARAMVNYKNIFIGSFESEEEAVAGYNKWVSRNRDIYASRAESRTGATTEQ